MSRLLGSTSFPRSVSASPAAKVSGKKQGQRNNLAELYQGVEEWTTMMIRDIPRAFTQDELLEDISKTLGSSDVIDFFYLPVNTLNQCNNGFCFINFTSNGIAQEAFQIFDNFRFARHESVKASMVSKAHIQGLENNLRHLQERAQTLIGNPNGPVVMIQGLRMDLAQVFAELAVKDAMAELAQATASMNSIQDQVLLRLGIDEAMANPALPGWPQEPPLFALSSPATFSAPTDARCFDSTTSSGHSFLLSQGRSGSTCSSLDQQLTWQAQLPATASAGSQVLDLDSIFVDGDEDDCNMITCGVRYSGVVQKTPVQAANQWPQAAPAPCKDLLRAGMWEDDIGGSHPNGFVTTIPMTQILANASGFSGTGRSSCKHQCPKSAPGGSMQTLLSRFGINNIVRPLSSKGVLRLAPVPDESDKGSHESRTAGSVASLFHHSSNSNHSCVSLGRKLQDSPAGERPSLQPRLG